MPKKFPKDFINSRINKDHLWEMAMAFQVSKALFIANDLDIFTLLYKKPATAETLAKKLKLHPRPVSRILNAMVAFNLLKKENEKFSNTETANTLLVKGNPEYFGYYLNAINEVYNAWTNYEDVINKNHSFPLFRKEYAEGQEVVRRMMLAQEGFSYRQAVCLPKVFNFSKHKLLLDVGGGTGIFSVMASKANTKLKCIVFDISPMCKIARERTSHYKTGKKIKIVEGNFLSDELPKGADVALISTILDSYDEPECRRLIKKIHESLIPGGVLIVNEMMLNEERTGPLFPAIFSLELMIERNRGDARTVGEIRQWMKDEGFINLKTKPLKFPGETYLNCKIVIGKKKS